MAQVVLENIYKSFPRRRGDDASSSHGSASGGVSSGKAAPQDREDAAPQNISVLRRINLTVEDGEFMVLVGPSGCGKSTLLRLIAGLEDLTGGKIWVGDRLVNELPPKQRDIAMVFQSYALYPHMTVYDNLAFGLRRMPTASEPESAAISDSIEQDREKRTRQPRDHTLDISVSVGGLTLSSSVLEWFLTGGTRLLPPGLRYWSKVEKAIDHQVQLVAKMLQLDALLQRLPKELSGGQKQRVALGRAMARNPQVFLMDEPLSNLDAKLRTETRAQIVNLQRQLGTTTIYVTHDQTEAMTMGDRIAVMNQGQIQQLAAPLDLYNRPANRFVAEFIGSPPMNFLRVQVKAPLLVHHPKFRLTLPERWESALQPYNSKTLTLGIRPEHLSLRSPAPKNLPVQIQRVEALGSDTYVTVTMGEHRLQARIPPDQDIDLGKEIWLAIDPDQIHLFDEETGEAIR